MGVYSVILASGSYTSGRIISTEDLVKSTKFYKKDKNGDVFEEKVNLDEIKSTIGVNYRMWAREGERVEDLAFIALMKCFESSIIKPEQIDHVIVARNSGEHIPSIASKIANKVGIKTAISPDIIYGCQGWCYALRYADLLIKEGNANCIAVVGAEILSDIRGRKKDSLLFSDGAGAVILGKHESPYPTGIISSYFDGNVDFCDVLKMSDRIKPEEPSFNMNNSNRDLDMNGRQVFLKAVEVMPTTFSNLLEKANLKEKDVKYLLKHQASEKILEISSSKDLAVHQRINEKDLKKFVEQYRKDKVPNSVMWLGNSSVATIPTLLDIILKKKVDNPNLEGLLKDLEHYKIEENDVIAVLSVGAGLGWGGHLIKMAPIYWNYLKI